MMQSGDFPLEAKAYDAIREADQLFFLFLPLFKVSADQRVELGQVLLHTFSMNVLKWWQEVEMRSVSPPKN